CVDDTTAAADADIVVKEVEPPKRLDGAVDHHFALTLIGYVGDEGQCSAAFGLDHLDGLIGRLTIDIDDQHLSTRPGEQDRRRPAITDPVVGRAAAVDDRHFTLESKIAPCGVRHYHPAQRPLSHPPSMGGRIDALAVAAPLAPKA